MATDEENCDETVESLQYSIWACQEMYNELYEMNVMLHEELKAANEIIERLRRSEVQPMPIEMNCFVQQTRSVQNTTHYTARKQKAPCVRTTVVSFAKETSARASAKKTPPPKRNLCQKDTPKKKPP
jgi:hypothetical protein